jgi:antitoxin CcdA
MTVTLPAKRPSQARALDANRSQDCESGPKAEIAKRRSAQWVEGNRDARLSSNDHVEHKGPPLAEFRQF